ncbi:hypothetical protein HUX88_24595 [Duganella sp. BJB1802]|uniref:hypothetical protein n=1 Tax=Duganella sp. BJB1802 TaxID=2744575 RepID=UPI001593BC2B|nr:hypothetical protein [Duganella sp. BJB1802]NVD73694.1 hypothetical protein [Duganella sp. BJB1802]
MRLRRVWLGLSALALATVLLNVALVLLIQRAHTQAVGAQAQRQLAQGLTAELQQEAEQLASLARSYAATGQPRYLWTATATSWPSAPAKGSAGRPSSRPPTGRR